MFPSLEVQFYSHISFSWAKIQTVLSVTSKRHFLISTSFFLQRGREAQRCQVTPYVVNVAAVAVAAAVAAAAEGSDS